MQGETESREKREESERGEGERGREGEGRPRGVGAEVDESVGADAADEAREGGAQRGRPRDRARLLPRGAVTRSREEQEDNGWRKRGQLIRKEGRKGGKEGGKREGRKRAHGFEAGGVVECEALGGVDDGDAAHDAHQLVQQRLAPGPPAAARRARERVHRRVQRPVEKCEER